MSHNALAEKYQRESTIFPSEKVGFVVRRKTIYDAWLETLSHIEQFGELHEYGASTKRLRSFTWIAENESGDTPNCSHISEELQKMLSVTPDLILEYVKKHFLQYGGTQTSAYNAYGTRLCIWGGLFNQVEAVIAMLKECPETRRAFLSTFRPSVDLLKQRQPPCLVGVQFLKDGTESLDVFATFRSHDIFREGIKNAFGILYLMRYVAHKANMRRGRVIIVSHDAHVHLRDSKGAQQVVQCARENNAFTAHDSNPRGSFHIYLSDSKIKVDCVNDTRDLLRCFSGSNADDVYQKMAQHHLVGRPECGYYLGIQLARAEECLRRGLPFTQDQPITI